jgi:hypothetical protein
MSNRQGQHSAAGVVTTLQVSIPGRGKTFFSIPEHPHQLCGLPGLLFNEYWRSYPRCRSHWGITVTTHIHLLPRSRESGTICLFPLYAFMVSTRATVTLPFFSGNNWASRPAMCAEYQRFLVFEAHILLRNKTNSLHGLPIWQCHLQLFLIWD